MFKAKLIENESYYNLRSKQIMLVLLPSIPAALIVFFTDLPVWISILLIVGYILIFLLFLRNKKMMNAIISDKMIELDGQGIRIKSKNGSEEEFFNINAIKKIILKKEYGIPQESFQDIKREINGTPQKNYLILYQNNTERKFDFEIESHYMLNQFSKIIKEWNGQGRNIEFE